MSAPFAELSMLAGLGICLERRSLAELGFDPRWLAGDISLGKSSLASPPDRSNGPESESGGKDETEDSGQEVVVLVGPPASGKSTLAKDRLPGHYRCLQIRRNKVVEIGGRFREGSRREYTEWHDMLGL